jgi:hypothetical protein
VTARNPSPGVEAAFARIGILAGPTRAAAARLVADLGAGAAHRRVLVLAPEGATLEGRTALANRYRADGVFQLADRLMRHVRAGELAVMVDGEGATLVASFPLEAVRRGLAATGAGSAVAS